MMKFITKITLWTLTLVLIWGVGLVLFVSHVQKQYPFPEQNADAIIVLTGGKNRIETGFLLLGTRSEQLFITGVHPDTTLADIKEKHGHKSLPCCVTLGHEATTTQENAEEVKKWLTGKDYKSFLLVTSDYHMPRALLEFNTIIDRSQISPLTPNQLNSNFPDSSYNWSTLQKNLPTLKLILSEYHKTIFRWLQIKLDIEITQ